MWGPPSRPATCADNGFVKSFVFLKAYDCDEVHFLQLVIVKNMLYREGGSEIAQTRVRYPWNVIAVRHPGTLEFILFFVT